MEDFKIFESEEFGEVHILDDNGELWFIGKEIARALKYKDPKAAVRDRVDAEDKREGQNAPTLGGAQTVTLINESGFYSLVLSSKLPAAKRFKRWVTSEVIPSIRKTGSYALTKSAVLPSPIEKNRRPLSPTACVYALLMSDGTVKIGHSGNLRERVAKIERQTGLKVHDLYFTFSIARETARSIEWACQKKFSLRKVEGEFFNCTFNEICNLIDSFVKVELERNDQLLKVADRMESSHERHLILIRAANLFVGKLLA